MSGVMGPFRRVVLGVSGGVDSAASALLLKRKGYEVTGVFMRNWDEKDEKGHCTVDAEAEDAEWVCKKLDIPFHEVNLVQQYWNDVFTHMLEEYKAGFTPNPDILCNKAIKFSPFLQQAEEKFGAEIIATGHYARTSFGENLEEYEPTKGVKLLQAMDRLKDQTFFMSQVSQKALQHTMFPLGNYTKDAVRKIAESGGLSRVAHKRDSTGICFIGSRNFQDFITQYIDDTPGKFIDLDTGEEIGEHRGFHHWTLGQGCHLGGTWKKYFIAEKHPETGNISVVAGSEHPALYTSSMLTGQMHWIHSPPTQLYTNGQLECHFRFQHGLPLIPCVVTADGSNPWHSSPIQNNMRILLAEPLRAITAGQYAVLYLGEECLGSARIMRPGPSLYTLNVDGCRTKILEERKSRREIILGRNRSKMFRNKKEPEKLQT